jgi:hypothetical protein
MIVKYELENRTTSTGIGLTAPECINDGGYFPNTDNTLIGYSDGTHDLGSNCIELTASELEARQLAIHSLTPMMKDGDTPADPMIVMTDDEVRTLIQDWIANY